MTYCLAWKSANSIFFAADSSVTSNNSFFTSRPKLKSIPSSFNEYSRHPNGKYTEEAIIKILTFKNSVAVSFAGDLKDISATLDVFRRALEYNSNPHTALTTAVNSSAPAESIHRASIIIGYLEEGKPILLCYNENGDRKIREIDSIVQIGSGANRFRVFTHDIIKKFLDENLYDYQFLPLVSALLQNFGVHNNLVSLKSGGTFYGVRIDINGIEWQPDTVYVIYGHHDGKIEPVNIVNLYIRENALITRSTYTRAQKILMWDTDKISNKEWERKWNPILKSLRNELKADYYSFLSSKYPIITVIKTDKKTNNKYFEILEGRIKIKPELMKFLVNYKPPKAPKIGLMLSWLKV